MPKSYYIAAFIALAAIGWIGSGLISPGQEDSEDNTTTEAAVEAGDQPNASGQSAEEAPENKNTPDKNLQRVRVQQIASEIHIATLSVYGRTEAARKVAIKAQTAAQVKTVEVDKGSVVTDGQVLIRLNTDDRAARLNQARALLEQRQIEFNAASKLQSKNFTSRTKLAQAEAVLADAKAELASIQLDLARTTIEAPFDGLLNDRQVEVGDWVNVGTTVATVLELDPLKVVADVAEIHAASVRIGGQVSLHLVGGKDLTGTVSYVSAEANSATRTYKVEVTMANPGHKIPEGMTAEVRLPLQQVRAHKVSPALLTLNDEGIVGVKMVDAENRARFFPADIIDDAPDGIWLGNLPDDARFITVGQEYVNDGQMVEPVEGDIPSQQEAAVK